MLFGFNINWSCSSTVTITLEVNVHSVHSCQVFQMTLACIEHFAGIDNSVLLAIAVLATSDWNATGFFIAVTLYTDFYPNVTTWRSGLCCGNSVCLSSVVCRSVTLVYPTQGLKLSAKFLYRCVRWPSSDLHAKFYGDRPKRTLPSGALNARGVAKYSDFRPVEGYIS